MIPAAYEASQIKLTSREEALMNTMHLLSDKTRFKMFKLLTSTDEMCVSEIAGRLGITVSAVSQHFKILESAGLVRKQRMGQKICYRLHTDDLLVHELVHVLSSPQMNRNQSGV